MRACREDAAVAVATTEIPTSPWINSDLDDFMLSVVPVMGSVYGV